MSYVSWNSLVHNRLWNFETQNMERHGQYSQIYDFETWNVTSKQQKILWQMGSIVLRPNLHMSSFRNPYTRVSGELIYELMIKNDNAYMWNGNKGSHYRDNNRPHIICIF